MSRCDCVLLMTCPWDSEHPICASLSPLPSLPTLFILPHPSHHRGTAFHDPLPHVSYHISCSFPLLLSFRRCSSSLRSTGLCKLHTRSCRYVHLYFKCLEDLEKNIVERFDVQFIGSYFKFPRTKSKAMLLSWLQPRKRRRAARPIRYPAVTSI